jgi:malate dehydrogenase
MSFVAIIGAGTLGGTIAQTLAIRDRIPEIRLIDAEERIAQGKALDIRQSSPVEGFSTIVSAGGSVAAAAGASALIVADRASDNGEFTGEDGLALVRRLIGIEQAAPIVFAGASQRELMVRTLGELRVRDSRIVGSAPLALESGLRALAGLSIDASGVPIALSVVGVPPRDAVVAWEEATISGQPLSAHLPAHTIAALNSRIASLWPPGHYALASATTRVTEAIVLGSRQRLSCFVSLPRGRVASMAVELGEDGVRRVVEPVLTRQERTRLENGLVNP